MASRFRGSEESEKEGGRYKAGRNGEERGDIAGNNDNRDDNRIIVGSDGQCVILRLEESGLERWVAFNRRVEKKEW